MSDTSWEADYLTCTVKVPSSKLGLRPVMTMDDALKVTTGLKHSTEISGNAFWSKYQGPPYGDHNALLILLGFNPEAVTRVEEHNLWRHTPSGVVGDGTLRIEVSGGAVDMLSTADIHTRMPEAVFRYSILAREGVLSEYTF